MGPYVRSDWSKSHVLSQYKPEKNLYHKAHKEA